MALIAPPPEAPQRLPNTLCLKVQIPFHGSPHPALTGHPPTTLPTAPQFPAPLDSSFFQHPMLILVLKL